jgi:hypothetical protein
MGATLIGRPFLRIMVSRHLSLYFLSYFSQIFTLIKSRCWFFLNAKCLLREIGILVAHGLPTSELILF